MLTIQDHIALQQALIAALNGKIATAQALGDVARLAELQLELAEADQPLNRLLEA